MSSNVIEFHFKGAFDYDAFCNVIVPELESCIQYPDAGDEAEDTIEYGHVDECVECEYYDELKDMLSRIGVENKDGHIFDRLTFECTYVEALVCDIYQQYSRFPLDVDCTIELVRDDAAE